MSASDPISFTMEAFESTMLMGLSGQLEQEILPSFDVSAAAVIEFDLAAARATFKFKTDSYDITNITSNSDDAQYFVRQSNFTEFNPVHADLSHAFVHTQNVNGVGPIAYKNALGTNYGNNKMSVMHDFVRYLALRLFNTHYATDLFSNETELITDLSVNGQDTLWADISLALSNAGTEAAPLSDADASNNNLTRELLKQLAATDAGKLRLQNDISGISDVSAVAVPLYDGDTINFKITVKPHPDQHNLTGLGANAIEDRVYRVVLLLKSSPSNNVPDNS